LAGNPDGIKGKKEKTIENAGLLSLLLPSHLDVSYSALTCSSYHDGLKILKL
jgi:hypothetical protein